MTCILIADPNTASRKAMSLLLSHRLELASIKEAADAESLIRALADCPPDILLLDWHLYGAPGPEASRLFHKAYPEMKVVLLSVNAEDLAAAQNAGATFIHKGASPAEVLSELRPLLADKNPDNGAMEP